MAGSYRQIFNENGELISNEDFIEMIENLGDAYEMAEECYQIIQILSDGRKEKIDEAIKTIYSNENN